jgi:hypothetical protein
MGVFRVRLVSEKSGLYCLSTRKSLDRVQVGEPPNIQSKAFLRRPSLFLPMPFKS